VRVTAYSFNRPYASLPLKITVSPSFTSKLSPKVKTLDEIVGDGDIDDGVGVADGDIDDGVGVADGDIDTAGFGSITPLSQINFFPLLTHVYFLPLKIVVCPAFLQTTTGPLAPRAESAMEEMINVTKAIRPRREIRDMAEMLMETYERKVKCRKDQKVG